MTTDDLVRLKKERQLIGIARRARTPTNAN